MNLAMKISNRNYERRACIYTICYEEIETPSVFAYLEASLDDCRLRRHATVSQGRYHGASHAASRSVPNYINSL